MKFNMERGSLAQWFIVTVSGEEKPNSHAPDSKFNQLINAPDWNPEEVDVKVMLNGIEFDIREDIFPRMQDHIDKEIAKGIAQDKLMQTKQDLIQEILNARNMEDLKEIVADLTPIED